MPPAPGNGRIAAGATKGAKSIPGNLGNLPEFQLMYPQKHG